MSLKRILVLPDIHAPLYDNNSINVILSFCRVFKPTHFIQLGDFCDFNSLSTFELHYRKEFVFLDDELDSANELLDRIEKSLPRGCKKMMIGGNHEARYDKWLPKWDFYPNKIVRSIRKFKESWMDEYNLKKRGWQACEYGEHFEIGKLIFVHGWETNAGAPRKMITEYFTGKNIIYGHTHKHQVYCSLDTNGHPIEAESIGTLSNFNLSYLRGKPASGWTRGFVYIYMSEDGTFTKNFIHVIDGKFIHNGRVYRY